MEIIPTALDGVVEIRPPRHGDDRGWFSETYKRHALRDAGIDIEFVQDNESFSAPAGTLRGLHYQIAPHPQDKLIRVIDGSILDIVVDIRRGSPTFGRYVSVTLTGRGGQPTARARRVRPRILHARGGRSCRLQGERCLRPRLRTLHPLGRSRTRHRLATPGERPDALGQGCRRSPARRSARPLLSAPPAPSTRCRRHQLPIPPPCPRPSVARVGRSQNDVEPSHGFSTDLVPHSGTHSGLNPRLRRATEATERAARPRRPRIEVCTAPDATAPTGPVDATTA